MGIFDEHGFADEEEVVVDGEGLVGVGDLFHGEGDVESDGDAAGFFGAFVGGFHNAGAAAGDDGEAAAGEGVGELGGESIVFVGGFGAGRAEDADGRGNVAESIEAIDEFGHDAEDLPHVFLIFVGEDLLG